MLTQARVKKLFIYREDGCLIRRSPANNQTRIGDVIGSCNSSKRLTTKVDGRSYLVHRLVWLWHYGYLPEHCVDHIDRDFLNNRIANLREATQSCNMRNTTLSKHNTSGVKGVYAVGLGKYRVQINSKGKHVFLGRHTDFTEAVAHRLAAEQCLNWEGCDSRSPAYQYIKELNK